MDPETKNSLKSEVPPAVLRQVFLGIFLFLAPMLLIVVYPQFNQQPIAFGGKSILVYYLLLVALCFRVAWKDRAKLLEAEQRTDKKMRSRPILGPVWRIARVVDLIDGAIALVLLAYIVITLFK